eukprot:TRINITY_DN214_c1_g2_i5.p1 TRINITY_DN214_c1_g2~~TRINITY_DN214_c1_g2_i5.p1  ORF type:complete len:291 (+),score=76.09 TRINITY_DN214_c1_g2_i5:642-1514(+)
MASYSVPCPKTSAIASSVLRAEDFQQQQQQQQSKVSFAGIGNRRRSLIGGSSSDLSLSVRFQGSKRNQSTIWKAQVNEVAVEKSSNSTLVSPTNFEVLPSDGKDIEPTKEPGFPDSSIPAFMSEVASLVKLVDSRDIMELKLKQRDCELIIRKKEAFPQPTIAPIVMMQPPSAPMLPSQPAPVQTAARTAASAPASTAPPALPAPAKSSKSSHPPLKCPMAGTFYQCPAPGEPPFVKVGDKVQKGQVICIIEAMKLMNEIEADQSGTIVEIPAEDGKPVSVDTPLMVIAP